MNLYRIHCPEATRFAGSMADARKARQEIVDQFGTRKARIEIEDYELSTKKPDLVAALNVVAALADTQESGDQ